MPVMGSKTPTVNVSVPVPTPVQSAPKRPAVQFAPDETPQQPVGPSGVPPVAPPRPQMSAVILPWSPPPKGKTQMRRLPRRVVRYARDWGKGWWMSPKGEVHPLGQDDEHDTWLSKNTGYSDKTAAMNDGWLRLVSSRSNLYVEGNVPNSRQLKEIKDHAIIHGLDDVTHFDHTKEYGSPGQQRNIRLSRKVVRFSATPTSLEGMFRAARENPYEPTHHAVIADALDEAYPGNHISGLIRRQFGFGEHGGQGEQNNLWYEPVENSWDGTFPYRARLGTHGPFNLYLGHETPSDHSNLLGEPANTADGGNARWIIHAVSRLKGSRDFGYTFEFGHDKAHEIPRMFPSAANHIAGNVGNDRDVEARRFDDRMDEEERNRP